MTCKATAGKMRPLLLCIRQKEERKRTNALDFLELTPMCPPAASGCIVEYLFYTQSHSVTFSVSIQTINLKMMAMCKVTANNKVLISCFFFLLASSESSFKLQFSVWIPLMYFQNQIKKTHCQ